LQQKNIVSKVHSVWKVWKTLFLLRKKATQDFAYGQDGSKPSKTLNADNF